MLDERMYLICICEVNFVLYVFMSGDFYFVLGFFGGFLEVRFR